MSALSITAITNFILASEAWFLAGMFVQMPKEPYSAAWFWGGALILLGLSVLIGGIDHGFFEAQGKPRYLIQRTNWILLGIMTYFILMTTSAQFFPSRAFSVVLLIGLVQFIVYAILVRQHYDFRIVIFNYAAVMVLLLVMNFVGLASGTGSWMMISGILILFAASAIQYLRLDVFTPLDHDGLYHLVSMAGVLAVYLGGLQLTRTF